MLITHRANTMLLFLLLILMGAACFYYSIPWWLFLVPAAIWFIVAAIGSGFVWTGYHIKAYCKGNNLREKIIAISFDDGPTPETHKALDLLKKFNAKGTFFCIGRQIEKHPDIFKRVIAEGHTIGNHTYTHNPKMGFWNTAKVLDELHKTNNIIKEQAGKHALLFRPPYGVTFPALAKALSHTRHYVIGWNIRSLDAVIKDETRIYNRIKKRLGPGSIILLHDTSQKSINVLEQLLVLLQQNNYEAVTIDRLLNIPAYEE